MADHCDARQAARRHIDFHDDRHSLNPDDGGRRNARKHETSREQGWDQPEKAGLVRSLQMGLQLLPAQRRHDRKNCQR
jgi:hypothetical protein